MTKQMPRICASSEIDAIQNDRLSGDKYKSPYVNVEVEFDLGDGELALKLLRSAFDDAVHQVNEVLGSTFQ